MCSTIIIQEYRTYLELLCLLIVLCEVKRLKNDNLDITFFIENYQIHILKFTYECQTWNTPSHAHSSNSYEIHFVPKGKGTLFNAKHSYELYPGILYTTGPHIDHQQDSDPEDPTYEYCIYLKIDELHPKQKKTTAPSIIEPFLHYPFWYGKDHTDLQMTLEQIYAELFSPGPAASVMLQALFLQFFVKILRNYEPSSHAAISYLPIPLIKSYILIEDSFLLEYDTITLKELANRLGLSTRQTSRILYRRYGQNFLQKRTEARMAAAVTFLKENQLSVSEISSRLGYSYPNHFHTAFKNYYKMTISEYKQQILKSPLPAK